MQAGMSAKVDLHEWRLVDQKIKAAAEQGLMAVALDGEAYAKRKMTRGVSAPGEYPGVDIGNLRAGLHAKATDDPLIKQLRSSADYSHFLEWGTRRMAARPFMRPTARYMSKKAPKIMAQLMGGKFR